MSSEFIEWAKKNNKIKSVEEAFDEFPPIEEEHKGDSSKYITEQKAWKIAFDIQISYTVIIICL